ncbi:unnamed protein product [Cuscuta epithymum]|uniref:MADS-box domain-containing protein n=1 Tax=Cuscuta epithymum TaxID=186058 RepID=A0AAV0GJB1_9ASTE|nr:unnamed protein product [Cuscuta epithymum]
MGNEKAGKGKAKIEIKKIESLQARNICFSKRRQGLFKKSEELCRLFPGTRVAAVVYSPAGKPYFLGDPFAAAAALLSQDKGGEESAVVEKSASEKEEIQGGSALPLGSDWEGFVNCNALPLAFGWEGSNLNEFVDFHGWDEEAVGALLMNCNGPN